MAPTSLKTALLNVYGNLDLSLGIVRSLFNDFYKQNQDFYKSHPSIFPYGSIRALLTILEWPPFYERLDDYPDEGEPGWSEEVQGVTHDGENWFFAQNPNDAPKLWKFPVGHDLDQDVEGSNPSSGISNVGLPPSLSEYIHAGDIDYYDGHIYVPLQFGQPRKIAVYDAQSLDFIAAGDLEANGTAAWCAISPLNGLLYESKFYESDESSSDTTVSVYQRHLKANGLTLTYQGEFELFDSNGSKIILKRIQGGAFSKNGHLYLVSDSKDDNAGIYGFDMISGRKRFYQNISYDWNWPELEELEGITIWDLASRGAPSIHGQIHVILLDNDIHDDDNIYFLHFRVSGAAQDKI